MSIEKPGAEAETALQPLTNRKEKCKKRDIFFILIWTCVTCYNSCVKYENRFTVHGSCSKGGEKYEKENKTSFSRMSFHDMDAVHDAYSQRGRREKGWLVL